MTTAVKVTDAASGRIEGLAIPYGGPIEGRDLDGETFTKDTDFLLNWFPEGRPLLYNHGTDKTLDLALIGRQTKSTETDEGIWVEAQINMAHRYAQHVLNLIDKGNLGFSSGAHGQHVTKSADGKITRWPWIELSLTPTPANPYARVDVKSTVTFLKDLGVTVPTELDDKVDNRVLTIEQVKMAVREVLAEQKTSESEMVGTIEEMFETEWLRSQRLIAEGELA